MYVEDVWNRLDNKIQAERWPRIIVFRPSRENPTSMIVRGLSPKTGLLWDLFLTPYTVQFDCFTFTGLIPAGCETSVIHAEFQLFQKPQTIIAFAYDVPPVGSKWRDIVAREMH